MFTISFLSAKIQEDNCVLSFMVLYDFLACRDRDHLCVRERAIAYWRNGSKWRQCKGQVNGSIFLKDMQSLSCFFWGKSGQLLALRWVWNAPLERKFRIWVIKEVLITVLILSLFCFNGVCFLSTKAQELWMLIKQVLAQSQAKASCSGATSAWASHLSCSYVMIFHSLDWTPLLRRIWYC